MTIKNLKQYSLDSDTTIVTTFNEDGYRLYGESMLKSFDRKMPDINFVAYYEGFNPEEDNITSRIEYLDLEEMCPELVAFKERWKDVPEANGEFGGVKSFIYNIVRFSHKMFCIYHAAKTIDSRYLIWLDADTEVKKKFDKRFFINMLPEGKYCAYLGRPHTFSECGFMIFDTWHSQHVSFMDQYIDTLSFRNFMKEEAWTDCHLFDAVREKNDKKTKVFHDLTPGVPKKNFDIALSPCIVHHKGSRKITKGKKSDEKYNSIKGGRR